MAEIPTGETSRNYHYLRYVIFGVYILSFIASPYLLRNEFVPVTMIAMYYVIFTILCMIMDIRNYFLYRKEERFRRIMRENTLKQIDTLNDKEIKRLLRHGLPVSTIFLQIFYLCCALYFFFIASAFSEKIVVLTESEALARGTRLIRTKTNTIPLPGGWTKIIAVSGNEYLIKNENIQTVRRQN